MSPPANEASIAKASATSGGGLRSEALDDLCHLIVSRHGRLRLLICMHAPDIVVRNERRMLWAAVGAIVEKSRSAEVASPDDALAPRDSFGRSAIAPRDEAARAGLIQGPGKRARSELTMEIGR